MTPIVVQVENASDAEEVPEPSTMHCWVSAVLNQVSPENPHLRSLEQGAEINIRIVGADESAELNGRYRHQPKPTNVLSFPADLPDFLALPLLGDLAICAPVVQREAREQGKTTEAHWAHMVVHGTLHLLGYDHQQDREATAMEALETDILTHLGYPAPYRADLPETHPL